MIDGSEERNRQLAFELQNLHVCEKRSSEKISFLWPSLSSTLKVSNDQDRQLTEIEILHRLKSIAFFMLDARKDPASVKALYDKLVAEGVKLDESFLQNLNHIMLKYSETVPFEVPTQTSSPSEVRICHP